MAEEMERRSFLKGVGAAALAAPSLKGQMAAGEPARPPNVVLYVADEVRWDCIGAYGLNPSARTPNLDRIYQQGVTFTTAVTNQPLCSPSRACMLTGRYATETNVWTLGRQLSHDLPTLATVLRERGYTANFVGKWHLSDTQNATAGLGWVKPEDRGGFLDFWEGANVLELTSHPYYGTIWDSAGNPIAWKDQYRVDFLTDRAVRFLQQPQTKPFLLFISQLEPHQQNDEQRMVGPNGGAARFQNPHVPPDLLHLPGDWQQQLPDYLASIESIDASVGRILKTLESTGQLDNTIFVFTSDHGCHFRTRNAEYKRSPHDSSIRIPLLLQGPGLNQGLRLEEVVGNIDLTPTLLEAAGAALPSSMKGRSLMPLVRDPAARQQWDNTQLIQISQAMVGRALRTREWTYCAADASLNGNRDEASQHYSDYCLYNNFADPAQLVNLAGHVPEKAAAAMLRQELLTRIAQSGEIRPTISPARLYS